MKEIIISPKALIISIIFFSLSFFLLHTSYLSTISSSKEEEIKCEKPVLSLSLSYLSISHPLSFSLPLSRSAVTVLKLSQEINSNDMLKCSTKKKKFIKIFEIQTSLSRIFFLNSYFHFVKKKRNASNLILSVKFINSLTAIFFFLCFSKFN